MFRASTFPAILPACLSLLVGLAASAAVSGSADPSPVPVTCFVVSGNVACIDAGFVPALPGASVTTVVGPPIDGESESQTIRDDGGREVAIG